MIAKILREFYDKDNLKHLFKVGEEVEFADSRAEDIISRGLGECVTKAVPELPAEPVMEMPAEEKKDAEEEKEETPVEELPAEPVKRRGRPARS